jgi:hypothetical protein
MTNALAAPPMKRRQTKDKISDGSAMAAVETALMTSAVRSQRLGWATANERPASNAPMK